MTTAEEAQLREFGAELARAADSAWQPSCVARAWRTPRAISVHERAALLPAFTLQVWIDLDAVRSPLLHGEGPELGGELEAALEAFGLTPSELAPPDLAALAVAMVRGVRGGFDSALRMQPPADPAMDGAAPADTPDGFGDWLPLLAFLVTQCGLSVDDALDLRVDRALMLMAAVRRNQGWMATGTSYAFRELAAEKPQPSPEEKQNAPL
jgi:hypothetical protein